MRLPSAAVTVVSLAAVTTALLLLAGPASAQDVIANDDEAEAGRFLLRSDIWQGRRTPRRRVSYWGSLAWCGLAHKWGVFLLTDAIGLLISMHRPSNRNIRISLYAVLRCHGHGGDPDVWRQRWPVGVADQSAGFYLRRRQQRARCAIIA